MRWANPPAGVTLITPMGEDVSKGGACMGGPQSARPATGNRPPAGSEALVLLAGSASAAERALVRQWLRDGHVRPSAVLPLDGPGLARSLDRAVPVSYTHLTLPTN